MRETVWLRRALLPVVGIVMGCSGSVPGGGPQVETSIEPSVIVAGGQTTVTCTVRNGPAEAVTSYRLEPDIGWHGEGDLLTVTKAGNFVVRCEVAELDLIDPVGAELAVAPGEPVQVATHLDPPAVPVHQPCTVTCAVEDVHGNALEGDWALSIAVDEGLDLLGHQATSETPGTYEVRCQAPSNPDLNEVPAQLEVTPDVPVSVEITLKPDVPALKPGSVGLIGWIARDIYGNETVDGPAELVVPPGPTPTDGIGHGFVFEQEGLYPFTVRLEAPHQHITDTRVIPVDGTGPEVTILWPHRGATVQGTGEPVEVVGTISDGIGEVSFFEINGEPVSVGADGQFTALVDAEWGVNVLRTLAEDSYDNVTKISPSFAYSSSFVSFVDQDAKGVEQPDGLEVLLGQEFLDDGDHDPSHLDDLATILEVLLGELDIPAAFEQAGGFQQEIPLFTQELDLVLVSLEVNGTLELDIAFQESTDIGPTSVSLDTREGGLDTAIKIGNEEEKALTMGLLIDVNIPIVLSWWTLFDQGDIELSAGTELATALSAQQIRVNTQVDIHKDTEGPLEIDIIDSQITLEGLEVDPIEDLILSFGTVDLPLVGSIDVEFPLSDLVDINALTDSFLDPMLDAMVPALLEFMDPFIEELFDIILAELLMAFEIQDVLPVPDLLGVNGGDDLALEVYTRLSSVQFTEDGGQLGLGIGTHTEKAVDVETLGAIQRDGCLAGLEDYFVYGWDRPVGAAFKTNVVNGALFSLWWAGYLNGPIAVDGLLEQGDLPIPMEDITLELEWLLPPVVNDCGPKGVVEAEVGDIMVDLQASMMGMPIDALLYVDASVSLLFGSTEDGLTATLGDFKFLEVEVIELVEAEDSIFDIRDLLENQLQPLLESFVVGEEFGPITLPPIELDTVLPGLPEGAALEVTDLSVTKEQGYLVIGADLK